jgi:predicted GIY-YIG superfamily endonuclease
MHYVYVIESVSVPGHFYIGYTEELRERVRKHQADVSSHAAKFRPWKLKVYFAFESKETAIRFERYLKSGSGRAFCKGDFATVPGPRDENRTCLNTDKQTRK